MREHQHLFLIGPTGVGKTWLARAFAQKACRDGYTALFLKAAELFRELAMACSDGSHAKVLDRLSRVDLLIVDDWAMAPLTETERRDFLEICDGRYQVHSTLLTGAKGAQTPPARSAPSSPAQQAPQQKDSDADHFSMIRTAQRWRP